MRILMVIHQFFPRYTTGTEVITLEVATRFQALGHDVRILTAEPGPANELPASGDARREDYQFLHVDRVPYDAEHEPARLRDETFDPRMYDWVRDYLKANRPDVVQVMHQLRWSTAVVHAAKDLDIPVVFTVTDFWAICHNYKLLRHDGAVCDGPDRFAANCVRCYQQVTPPARRRRMPDWTYRVLARVAASVPRRLLRAPQPAKSGRQMVRIALEMLDETVALQERPALQRAMLARCDRVIAPTAWTAQLIARQGVPPERLLMSPYGLNAANTLPHQFKPIRVSFRFGYLGQLAPHKGVIHLVRAFRALLAEHPPRPVELYVHGDETQFPDYSRRLRELAESCEAIHFQGPYAHERIGELMADLDAVVCPSVWYENAPMVVNEAFATRTPVIATNLGGLSTVVEHERNGLLFPPADVPALTAQMRRIVNDPVLWERLRGGIPPVKTIEQSADEYLSVYRSLAA